MTGFSHVDDQGAARMVDVSGKDVTVRTATAEGRVDLSPDCVALLRGDGMPKGDVLATARLAGIMGAKRTPDLVPLCHPIALHGVTVEELVRCMEVHFCGRFNRLLFSLTPRTHGQHYRTARHEMREWRLPRWEEQFRAAGFAVDRLEGFRFHQVLEATPSCNWDSALYYRAVRMIHAFYRFLPARFRMAHASGSLAALTSSSSCRGSKRIRQFQPTKLANLQCNHR